MTPQDYAALGNMFREAIEKHVLEAVTQVSGQVAQQIAERDEQIKALQAKAAQPLDLSALTTVIDDLRRSIPAPYDDDALVARVAKQLEDFRAELPAPYDDSGMKSAFSAQGKRVDAVIEGIVVLKERVEEVSKSIPGAYDDEGLRAELAGLADAVGLTSKELETVKRIASERPEPVIPQDGKDALALEVLPAIDEQKSYQRGTYAKHAGGLWRSFEQTHGMRGWECIVAGVKQIDVSMLGKILTVNVRKSDGETESHTSEIPVQVYKGVFAPQQDSYENSYQAGDTVTWAGSLWHCNVTGTKAKPGDGSPDWTLAVKKGRDGREVVSVSREQKPVQIGGQ